MRFSTSGVRSLASSQSCLSRHRIVRGEGVVEDDLTSEVVERVARQRAGIRARLVHAAQRHFALDVERLADRKRERDVVGVFGVREAFEHAFVDPRELGRGPIACSLQSRSLAAFSITPSSPRSAVNSCAFGGIIPHKARATSAPVGPITSR